MNLPQPQIIRELDVVSVLNLEPPGMFEGVFPIPEDAAELRKLFQRTAPPEIGVLPIVQGSASLIPVTAVMQHLGSVAVMLSRDVKTLGDVDIYGGYAFLDRGVYALGVEDDSTLLETLAWDQSVESLKTHFTAEIRYACDQFFDATLDKQDGTVRLKQRRSGLQYQIPFDCYRLQIQEASEQLRSFAVAFVPVFEKHLKVAEPRTYALESFKNRLAWFDSLLPSKGPRVGGGVA